MLGLPLADEAERVILGGREAHAAPDLFNAEVLSALRRLERHGDIDAARVSAAVEDIHELPVVRYPTLPLLDRATELRHNMNAYDAMYVALAEILGTPLLTADERLATAAREHSRVAVTLLG